MKCQRCNKRINRERLAAIPDTKVCARCSEEQPLLTLPVYDDDGAVIDYRIVGPPPEQQDLARMQTEHLI